jgi:hypothetical protein
LTSWGPVSFSGTTGSMELYLRFLRCCVQATRSHVPSTAILNFRAVFYNVRT